MKCRFSCEKPDEITFTMTITMSAKEWCDLRDQLQQKWPSSSLSSSISDLLAQARKIYWPKDEQ